MRERYVPQEFYTGGELERDTFGVFKATNEFRKAYNQVREGDYVPYAKALDLIRDYYVEDASNPGKEFANDLRLEIAELLELPTDQIDNLKFYTAVGTVADIKHGIDAFIDYADSPHERPLATVTLDITKNPNKDTHKANVIINESLAQPEDEEYLDQVEKWAKIVARKLKSEIDVERSRKAPARHVNIGPKGRRRAI